jgi:hypothetical protein
MAADNDFFSKLIEKTDPIAELGEMLQTNTYRNMKIAPLIKTLCSLAGFNGLENMLHLMTMYLKLILNHQTATTVSMTWQHSKYS